MIRTARARALSLGIAALLAAPLMWAELALAQDPPPVRIRGTIERVDGATYVVKARDGAELKVTVADNPQIAGIIKASLSDIKQNSFVGVTAMPQADGSLIAVEVHIFPESMRGTGEGHYPWDLQPKSTMTNANVEQVVSAVDGRTLTLKHKDGETKITVPANAPIVTYVAGDKSDIKAGAKVFIVAVKQPDGRYRWCSCTFLPLRFAAGTKARCSVVNMSDPCPLFPQKRTFVDMNVMSAITLRRNAGRRDKKTVIRSTRKWWPAMALFAQRVRPVGQAAIGRNVIGLTIALCAFIVLWSDASVGQPGAFEEIYTTRAVVTGKDERNRPFGFKLCLEDVLVKVSGDASILSDSRLGALAVAAEQYVSAFYYRDRFEGKPIHDEQGTYDRPHFLTCQFDPQKINGVSQMLGRKPWLAHRPRLVMVLKVHGRTNSGLLSRDGPFDPDMREALANAAQRYGLTVNLPTAAMLEGNQIYIDTAESTSPDGLLRLVELSDSELPLVGDLRWSDAALGWVANWNLPVNGQSHGWSVSGVNYDEAFRNAVRGAAQILSGSGEPM